jgi:hypothetical protein
MRHVFGLDFNGLETTIRGPDPVEVDPKDGTAAAGLLIRIWAVPDWRTKSILRKNSRTVTLTPSNRRE